MKEYQTKQWLKMVDHAEDSLKSDCPLIEDEVMVAAATDMQQMWEFINYIANDYIELSHDKVRVQRDDYVQLANKLLNELRSE
jgi:hypothetical protein